MGGGSDKAQREAQAAEDQRRQLVQATQQRIEGIYSDPNRENDVRDVENATRDYLTSDLNRQNTNATREMKFAMARNGQTMGSVDVDANQNLAEKYLRAAVEVQRRANAAGNSLRQADQESKLNLFSQAAAGLDMTTSARQAGESMRNNIAGAKASALESGMGDLFSDFGNIYKRSREKAGERAAQPYEYRRDYAPNSWYGSGTGPG